jgi:hypothetical protein
MLSYTIIQLYIREVKNIKRGKVLRGAVVLLIAVAMIFSSIAIADTQKAKPLLELKTEHEGTGIGSKGPVVWDNGMEYDGLFTSQFDESYPFESECADDFHFEEETEVTDIHWIAAYWNGEDYNTVHWPWRIRFYTDDGSGTKPNNLIADFIFDSTQYTETLIEDTGDPATGIYYEISVDLPVSVTLSACYKYWISIQGIGAFPPQSGWGIHYDPIKLHEGVFRSEFFEFPDWTDTSVVNPPDQRDFCFQLTTIPCDPCIDVEKYVWDKNNQEWVDADDETSAIDLPVDEDITFKIVIHNCGDVDLYDIVVNDKMHDSLKYLAGDPEPDQFQYEPPYYYLYWYFPGPFNPCDIIELYITAKPVKPNSYDFNYVEVLANGCGNYVRDEDYCWVHGTKVPKTFDMPFVLRLFERFPNMFPLLRQILRL